MSADKEVDQKLHIFSSRVNEVVRTISNFLRRDLSREKRKINNFPPLRIFCAQKIVAFVVFCSLVFVF